MQSLFWVNSLLLLKLELTHISMAEKQRVMAEGGGSGKLFREVPCETYTHLADR